MDLADFAHDDSVYGSGVAEAKTREAKWMRVELTRVMRRVDKSATSSPFPELQTRSHIEAKLNQTRRVDGRRILCRPRPYNFVTHGASTVVINLATDEAKVECEMKGIGSLSCASPNCFGRNGLWDTKPIGWQHKTAAHGWRSHHDLKEYM